jgi:DNA-binding CsgD family transcriptional regulator
MFDIEKIFDTLQDMEELFYEYQDKLKNAEGYILEIQKLKNKYTEIDQTNGTFINQIQHQFENEDLNGFENWLKQRIPKAFDFYATFIVSNFLDKLHEFQSQIALFYGVSALRKELDLLVKNIESIVFMFEKIQNLSLSLEFDANKYIKQKKQATKNNPKSKISTTQITLELIQEGKRIGEIAVLRNLTEATIFTHFAKLFEQQLITIDQMLDQEVQKQLEQICAHLPENADFAFIQKQNYAFDYKYISFWRSYRSKKEVVKS